MPENFTPYQPLSFAATMIAIDHVLSGAALDRWKAPTRLWLERFEGLEAWFDEPCYTPALQALDTLATHLDGDAPFSRLQDDCISNWLIQINALYWHAKWPARVTGSRSAAWSPMTEPFQQFSNRYAAIPNVWQSDMASVDLRVAQQYLLNQL